MKKETKNNTTKKRVIKGDTTTQKKENVKGLTLYTFDDVVSAFYQGLLRGGQAVIYLHDTAQKEYSIDAINMTLNDFKETPEKLKELSKMPLREYLLYVDSVTKK